MTLLDCQNFFSTRFFFLFLSLSFCQRKGKKEKKGEGRRYPTIRDLRQTITFGLVTPVIDYSKNLVRPKKGGEIKK